MYLGHNMRPYMNFLAGKDPMTLYLSQAQPGLVIFHLFSLGCFEALVFYDASIVFQSSCLVS